ncbi:PilZ domain-containing protein [Pacificimonas sp. ICDLI1SI03]|mgnify:CR=1 FL=1|jgi:hypothetical protein|tara:strand:+ start:53218 stop:53556 length:339 start_codon:yes stop_codon:yes gene_type:complete
MTALTEIKKRDERARILRAGIVRVDDLERKVLIRDISESGAHIQCDVELQIGEEILLSFSDSPPLPATVRWEKGDRFGVEFERRIELDSSGKPTAAALNAARSQRSFVSWKK